MTGAKICEVNDIPTQNPVSMLRSFEFSTFGNLQGKIDFFVTQLIMFLETYHTTKFFFILLTNVRFGFVFSHLGSNMIISIMIIFCSIINT